MTTFEILSSPNDYDFPDEWYDLSGTEHFWVEWRKRAVLRFLAGQGVDLTASWRGFDIGCAHGVVSRQLEAASNWTIDGCDLTRSSLAQNGGGRGRVMFYNIHDRHPDFREAYDVIVLFDVIEHIEDTAPFLDSALYHLRPGGRVLVNVPALQGMYSKYDEAAGHFRRYSRDSLAAELTAGGLEVEATRYWGLSLVPVLWLRKMLIAHKTDTADIIRSGFQPPSPLVNSLFKGLMRLETGLVAAPPAGSSVMAVARKPT